MGTVPHALIAAYGGDTVSAAHALAGRFAGELDVTVLVDYDNRSVSTALDEARALGDRLWGYVWTRGRISWTPTCARVWARGLRPG